MERRYQAIFVTADVEYGLVADLIRAGKDGPQLHKIGETSRLDDAIPMLERTSRVTVCFRKFIEPFPGNDVHYPLTMTGLSLATMFIQGPN